jgi:tetratricopeptide (TPR) repeat protein
MGHAVALSAHALAQLGQAADAVTRILEGERLLEDLIARGAVQPLRLSYYQLGRSYFLLNRLDSARDFADRGVKLSPFNAYIPYALHLLGDIASHPQRCDPEGGKRYYGEALTLAEARGMRPLVSHCHLGLGTLYRRTGKRQEAEEHLTASSTMYRDMGLTYWLEKAEAEMQELG